MIYNTPTDLIIYETNDYTLFKLYEVNRVISKNVELERDINNCNKLRYHPITIDKNFFIVDGQHRFTIAKKLELPIYYMIDSDATDEEINQVQNAKCWHQRDWLHYYSSKNVGDYVFIKEMIDYFQLSVTAFLDSFATVGANKGRTFKNGATRLIYEKQKIKDCLRDYQEVSRFCYKIIEKKFHLNFEHSLIYIILQENYDHDHFIRKIKSHPDVILEAYEYKSRPNIRRILIEKVYNKNLKINDRRIEFKQYD